MARSGGCPLRHVYDAAYTGVPNWDIGRPQRAFVFLEEENLIRDPVLDVGCGTGELSLFLARRGHDVLGIDLSSVAIRHAQQKAQWRRIPARFLVLDALYLSALREVDLTFRTVVDCAMFHILGERERSAFVDALETVLRPGGRYYVLGDAQYEGRPGYGISPGEIHQRFTPADGWEILFVHRTGFERRGATTPAYFVGIERQ